MAARVESRWRVTGALGVASAVLLLVSAALVAGAPFPNASAAQIVIWYQQNRTLVQTAAALNALAAVPLLLFVSGIRHEFTLTAGDDARLSNTLFAGTITFVSLETISSLPAIGMSLLVNRPGSAPSDALVHLLADLSFFQHGNIGILASVFIGSLGLLALRGSIARRWVGWMAVTAAVFGIVGGFTSFFPSVTGKANAIATVSPFGFLLTQLTVIITGILMLTGRNPAGAGRWSPNQNNAGAGAPHAERTKVKQGDS